MTPIYVHPGFWWRNTISVGVLVIVGVYGVWELWAAANGPADASVTGYLFGAAFVGGAAYGLWQLINDAADRVMTFDIDEATEKSVVAFWRPFWTDRIAADLARVSDWRFHVAIGSRNAKTFFVYADHKDYPRPLQFELRRGIGVEGLRKVAPEAVAEYERATGLTKV